MCTPRRRTSPIAWNFSLACFSVEVYGAGDLGAVKQTKRSAVRIVELAASAM